MSASVPDETKVESEARASTSEVLTEVADAGAGAGAGAGAPRPDVEVAMSPTGSANALLPDVVNPDAPPSTCLDKGTISNLITFAILILGIILIVAVDKDENIYKYILSAGLFGFAGGMTNWLAVKMLFDKVPFLIGSGVIPNNFKEIRETVKSTIMATFFDEEYLQAYLGERATQLIAKLNLEDKLEEELQKPEIDDIVKQRLNEVMAKGDQMSQVLMMASMAMGGVDGLAPQLKPVLASFGRELVRMFVSKFDATSMIDVPTIRAEIDALMTEKLQQLTPEKVKVLMERVIREKLHWLVIWGNVFGAVIGLISQAVGFGA